MSFSQPSLSQGYNSVGMSDKLHYLKTGSQQQYEPYSDFGRSSLAADSEQGLSQHTDTEEKIGTVLRSVDTLSEEINRIEELIVKIANNHTAILSSHQNEAAKTQNDRYHNEVKTLSHHIADELKQMQRQLDDEASGSDRHSADYRIRRAQYNTLARRFRDTMMKVSEEEENYRGKNKEALQRQLKITGQFQTEEEVEEILEKDNPQLFVENILGKTDQRMLNEVQTRHQEVLKLESNVRDLHDMFYDLAQLVYDQDDLINQIEFGVEKASSYVTKANQSVRVATDYRRKKKKQQVLSISKGGCPLQPYGDFGRSSLPTDSEQGLSQHTDTEGQIETILRDDDLINQIEFNVEKTSSYVTKANQSVRIVTDYERKKNKLKVVICCVVSSVTIIVVIVIIIVVSVFLYFTFGRN